MIVVGDVGRIALNTSRGSLAVIMETNDARCTTCGERFKKNERAVFTWDEKRHAQPSRLHREGEGTIEVRHDVCRHKPNMPAANSGYTSAAAAAEIADASGTLRERVYEWLLLNGPATDEQMQDALAMNPSTQRPRRIELVNAERVRDTGDLSRTKSGRAAVLWEAV